MLLKKEEKTKQLATTKEISEGHITAKIPHSTLKIANTKELAPANDFESKINAFRNLVNNYSSSKIKAVRDKMDELLNDLEAFHKVKVEEVEKNSEKLNEEILKKVRELEDKATKEITNKISELDFKKAEEIELAKKFAMEKAASGAINVIDVLEIAINLSANDPAVKNYVSGFKMALNQFIKWLSDLDIKQINIAPGDAFDENQMSAIEQVKSSLAKNTVVEVKKSGYIMHDKVIRHAAVSVSDGSLAAQKDNNQPKAVSASPKHAQHIKAIHPNNFAKNQEVFDKE